MGITATILSAVGGAYTAKRQSDVAKGAAKEQKISAARLAEEEEKKKNPSRK